MNIFISYKQTWIEKQELEKNLLFLKNKLEKLWHDVFIAYFTEYENMDQKELDNYFLENIKKADLVLAFVNYESKSEGQLLELWMAYALGKKIKLLVNKKIKDKFYLIYGLWEVIYFDKLEDKITGLEDRI